MKFAQYLNDNCVPEWKAQYLDYKGGKKRLKKISRLGPFKPSGKMSVKPMPVREGSRPSISSLFELPGPALDTEYDIGDRSLVEAVQSSAASSAKNGVNERTPLLEPIQTKPSERRSSLQRRHLSILNTALVSRLASRRSLGSGQDSIQLENSRETEKQEFLDWLNQELLKINTFYLQKEAQLVQRLLLLEDQLFQHKAAQDTDHENSEPEPHLNLGFLKMEIPSLPKFGKGRADAQSRSDYHKKEVVPSVPQARRQLKHALREFYRSLELLKGYRALNRTACRKMVKKYDKTTGLSEQAAFMARVNGSEFTTSDVLDGVMEKVEKLYSMYFEDGNRKLAVEKLRSPSKVQPHYGPLFWGGVSIGAAVPVMIFAILRGVRIKGQVWEIQPLFQIWGGLLIATLTAMMFAVHFYVWDHYKINYRFIFDFRPNSALDYRQYILMPSVLLLVGSIVAFFSFSSSSGWPRGFLPRDMPWIYVGLVLATVLNPLRMMYYRLRRWLWVTLWRLLWLGFYPVEFRDFFMGDIFCSLTYLMGNVSFFICLYAKEWASPILCGLSRSRLLGFLLTLPSIWRLLQCIRRYADTGEWFPHLANMGKYSVLVVYYMCLSVYRINKEPHKRAAFIAFAVCNSVYSSLWDIFMDWSLMQAGLKPRLLRNNLGYKNWPSVYYGAMVVDVVLRFQWVFYVFFSERIQQSSLTSFFIAIAELIRRFIWVFFRMENEHCSNVDLLKAAREVSLPYPINTRIEHTVQEDHGHSIVHDQESGPEDVSDMASEKYLFFRSVSRVVKDAHAKDFQRGRRRRDGEDSESGSESEGGE